MKIIHNLMVVFMLLVAFSSHGAESTVFEYSVDGALDKIYPQVYQALEDDGFYVVFEANIGRSIRGMAEKWGDDYNRNQLSGIRSMVFCNGWYANQVSNKDPRMLALCPMRMTLIEKNGQTTALFAKPSVIAANSPASAILKRLENEVIDAIKKAMDKK